MEEASIKKIKKRELVSRIVFIILCSLIGILLVSNGVLITNAYFSSSQTSSSVVTTGNVAVTLYDSLDNEITSAINLGTSVLVPGNQTEYTFKVKNTGRNNEYVRLSMSCLIDGSAKDSVVDMRSNEHTHLFVVGDYIYYNAEIAPNSTVSIPVKFVISEDFGNVDDEGNDYRNVTYSITVNVEGHQSVGVTLNQSSGWVM